MQPYYEDDLVTLYHGDSLDVLADLTHGSVAAVITDPPYILHAGSAGTKGGKVGGWGRHDERLRLVLRLVPPRQDRHAR